jgi:hypothetical protein
MALQLLINILPNLHLVGTLYNILFIRIWAIEYERQKRRRSSTPLQNMTCGIAVNIGSFVCSCAATEKGTVLKAIVVDFLNLLNRKRYRHSLVFFVSDLILPERMLYGLGI